MFTIGQLGVTAGNTQLTDLTISFYEADGTSLVNPESLNFEQHALAAAGFDGTLTWSPSIATGTGTLSVNAAGADTNSATGFFSPTAPEIGRIEVIATTTGLSDAVDFGFGTPIVVPAPAAVWLFGSGLLALVGTARRRRHSLTN